MWGYTATRQSTCKVVYFEFTLGTQGLGPNLGSIIMFFFQREHAFFKTGKKDGCFASLAPPSYVSYKGCIAILHLPVAVMALKTMDDVT